MAAPVPAKPPTFHFKLRLVDSAGNTFAARDYQLWWGGTIAQDGITDANGVVEADLDDAFDSGLLDIGELDRQGSFIARWTIPIEVVKPPPPLAPLPPPTQAQPVPKAKPKETNADWTTENDPEPPLPEWPGYEARPEDQQRYENEKKAHQDWERRQEQAKREAAERRKKDEEGREAREQDQKLKKDWASDPTAAGAGSGSPARPLNQQEREELQKAIQAHREELHAGDVLRFDIAWRLRNLGLFPGSGVPTFPIDGVASVALLRAMQRFAWRQQGQGLDKLTIVGPRSTEVVDLLDAIRKEHDG